MVPRAKKIAEYIRNAFSGPKGKMDELIMEALVALMDPPPGEIEGAAYVEQLGPCVREALDQHIENCKQQGVAADIEFGICSTIINKRYIFSEVRNDFLSWLVNISPYKFEALCKKILELEGCKQVQVTPASADGGIDFYGIKEIIIYDDYEPTIFQKVEVLIIGQAKKYTNTLQIEELRSFMGSIELMKHGNLKNAPNFLPVLSDNISYKPLSPIMLIFITSADAHQSVKDVASWTGIRLITGKELIDILYKNRLGFRMYDSGIRFEPQDIEI